MSRNYNPAPDPSTGAKSSHNGAYTYEAPELESPTRGLLDTQAEEVAIISHELRNSLAVISGAAALLRPPGGADDIDAARQLIQRHVTQMSRHVEDLLEPLGRDHGLRLTRIDLRVVARYAADDIASEMARHGHHLTVALPERAIWANADGERLEQVITNLLANAAKYTPDGGDIALVMERDGGHASIRVRDSGVGMDPAMLPRVFGMFVQAEAALPRSEGGHGIGLAVVKKLVELHGGTVTATSAGIGKGSEFAIVLPAVREYAQA